MADYDELVEGVGRDEVDYQISKIQEKHYKKACGVCASAGLLKLEQFSHIQWNMDNSVFYHYILGIKNI